MVRRLAMAVIGVCFFGVAGMSSANALTTPIACGAFICEDAGATTGSPFNSLPAAGGFATPSVVALTGTPPGGGFFHAFTFELNQFSSIAGTITNDNATDGFNILGLTLELFNAANTQVPGTFVVPPGLNSVAAFAYGGLAAGDYLFRITGQIDPFGPNTTSVRDGQYSGSFNVSEVPLPGAVWLFISAILGLVSFSRIRRSKQSA